MLESFCIGELGLSLKDFYLLTERKFCLLKEYHDRKEQKKLELFKIENNAQWQRARLVAYCASKPYFENQNVSIYEFFPLSSDPTEEELIQIAEEKKKKEGDYIRALLNKYKKI